jgi:hypothetical protein
MGEPKVLIANGHPKNIGGLQKYQLLIFSQSVRKNQRLFTINGENQAVKLRWAWCSNNER